MTLDFYAEGFLCLNSARKGSEGWIRPRPCPRRSTLQVSREYSCNMYHEVFCFLHTNPRKDQKYQFWLLHYPCSTDLPLYLSMASAYIRLDPLREQGQRGAGGFLYCEAAEGDGLNRTRGYI